MIAANIAAIILAAGVSSRMGKFKPLLPLDNKTVIEQVVATFLHAGVRDIGVVLGHKARDVSAVLENLAVSWCINDDYQSEMFNSVKVGADGLKHDSEAFFILPVDIPLIRPQTLRLLMEFYGKHRPQIIYPTFFGKRGHPPLIPRQYAGELTRWSGNGGLKGFLEQYDHRSLDVPVFDEGILMDMDTPEQYGQILARYENLKIPLKTECMAMLGTRFSENQAIVKHSRVVARIARDIGEKLVQAGCLVNINLVEACGYLHDIGKGERNHARFGAQFLKNMGYPMLADVIASHMDLSFTDGGKITEKEILYLADKMTSGERVISLDKRLNEKLKQLSGHPEGKKAAEKRLRTAIKIKRDIEKIVGRHIATA
jgi:putative nucleotidyltransferase with HDIG domain